jgi:hypothetical protein
VNHETLINFAEENSQDEIQNDLKENEDVFNAQLNELDEYETSENSGADLNFVDEERILANSEPENDEEISEEMFNENKTEEEVIFNHQLNEIDEFENEISDDRGDILNDFDEEEKIQNNYQYKNEEESEKIPSIFDGEVLDENEEILVEENEISILPTMMEQGELATDTSNAENIMNEIKNEASRKKKET